MITDGEAPYPSSKVIALRNLFALIRRQGCRTCAQCYFIKGTESQKIPNNYKRLCRGISAKIKDVKFDELL